MLGATKAALLGEINHLQSALEYSERETKNMKLSYDKAWEEKINRMKIELAAISKEKDILAQDLNTSKKLLDDAMVEIHSHSEDSLVDKRIVAKLLVTFLDRGESDDVLEVIAHLLDFSPEDKHKVGAFGDRKNRKTSGGGGGGGLLSWFSAPSSSDRMAPSYVNDTKASPSVSSPDTLSSVWVDFLLKELEDGSSSGQGKSKSRPSPTKEQEVPKISIMTSPPKTSFSK